MIGIYGGSFDPVHNGHIAAAEACIEQGIVEKIIFVPCHLHPFNKTLSASNTQRLAMLELATAEQPLFSIDTRELDHNKTSYMYDTLMSLQQDYPQESFALLLGTDTFNDLPKWHQWQKIIELVTIILLPRPGYQPHLPDPVPNLIELNTTLPDISSSDIKNRCAAGKSLQGLLPPAIIDYIHQQHIYG